MSSARKSDGVFCTAGTFQGKNSNLQSVVITVAAVFHQLLKKTKPHQINFRVARTWCTYFFALRHGPSLFLMFTKRVCDKKKATFDFLFLNEISTDNSLPNKTHTHHIPGDLSGNRYMRLECTLLKAAALRRRTTRHDNSSSPTHLTHNNAMAP